MLDKIERMQFTLTGIDSNWRKPPCQDQTKYAIVKSARLRKAAIFRPQKNNLFSSLLIGKPFNLSEGVAY
jgi:hypothetical protein